MAGSGWLLVGLGAVGLCAIVLICIHLRRAIKEACVTKAMKRFHCQREHLEAKFVELAALSGRPRGMVWSRCDFEDGVSYVRDKRTGGLSALVAVAIGFTAEDDGGMQDVAAEHDLRAATALFHCVHGDWTTTGRTLFNLSPTQAVGFYRERLEVVAQEKAGDT